MHVEANGETYEIDAAAEKPPTMIDELDAIFDTFGAELEELPFRKATRAAVWIWVRRRDPAVTPEQVRFDVAELSAELPDEDDNAPKLNRAARKAKNGG